MKFVYRFPTGFRLEHDSREGYAHTHYEDGAASLCPVVKDDYFHAQQLGIAPGQHRLLHELSHHLVGIHYYKKPSSPVIWHDAHGRDPQAELGERASLEEWMVNALVYHCFDMPTDYGALVDLQGAGAEVPKLRSQLKWLLATAKSPIVGLSLEISL